MHSHRRYTLADGRCQLHLAPLGIDTTTGSPYAARVMTQPTFNPTRTFLQLDSTGRAVRLDTSKPGFWQSLRQRNLEGRLVGIADMRRHSGWEMHPDGDEVLFLLTGSLEIALDRGAETEVVSLSEGRMCVVPKGVWHRLLVREPGKLLFATPGPSTEQRGVREHKALQESAR